MLTTPLLPMVNATEARTITLSGDIDWEDTVKVIQINDQGVNNLWSGVFTRTLENWVAISQSSAADNSPYHTYVDGNWNKSLVVYDDGTSANKNWSIVNTNLPATSFFSDLCELNNGGTGVTYDAPTFNNSYCINDNMFEGQLEITTTNATFPEAMINIFGLSTSSQYSIDWELRSCSTSNVQASGFEQFENLNQYTKDLSFPNRVTGDWYIWYELNEIFQTGGTTTIDELYTGCTGSPPNAISPSIDSVSITSQDSITGLMTAVATVTNLTANTIYQYSHKAYEHVQNQCGFYGNNEPLIEASGNFSTPSTQVTTDIINSNFVIGANWTGAYPVELHFGNMYCYVFQFEKADGSGYGYMVSDILGPSQTPACDQLCWDHTNYAPGASFSPNGEWATYSHFGAGEIIGETPIPVTGKWYWEYDIVRNSGQLNSMIVGVHTGMNLNMGDTGIGTDLFGWGIDSGGYVYHENEAEYVGCSVLDCWETELGVTIGIAVDMDDGTMWYSKNGIWAGGTGSTPNDSAHPIFGTNSAGVDAEWDDAHGNNDLAGSQVYPAFSITSQSGNSVHLVTGDILTFEPPEGFTALDLPDNSDEDGDGLPDDWESQYGLDPGEVDSDGDGTNDNDQDMDGDGLSNLQEYNMGTNPQSQDTDGDGIDDSADVFPLDPLECCDADGDGTGNNADPDDDNDGVSDLDDCAPLDSDAWVLDEQGICGSDDNEIEFCYDFQSKDIEHGYVTEVTCTEAGFMWSTDELKNLDISLGWDWGDYDADGVDESNLKINVNFPDSDDSPFSGQHYFNIILEISDETQIFVTQTRFNNLDLSNVYGLSEFFQTNGFPDGDYNYCVYVEIRQVESTDTVSLDGVCENMNVGDAPTDGEDDPCFGPGDYLLVENFDDSSMDGRYFPNTGYLGDSSDPTKIIAGEGIYWDKEQNLDGTPGFGWSFYRVESSTTDYWRAMQGTNPPGDLTAEGYFSLDPFGEDHCNPEGHTSSGSINYNHVDSSDGDINLEPRIVWNPNTNQLFLDFQVSIDDEEDIDQVIVYYEITGVDNIDGFSFEMSENTGIMNLDGNGEVNYNVEITDTSQFPESANLQRYHTYCLEFNLEAADGEQLERSTGCMYIGDGVIDTQEVDWESDVNSGSTSVTSMYANDDGTKAVDDDFETQWTSNNDCINEAEIITIDLATSPTQEFQLISGVSLKWGETTPYEYKISVFDSNNIWKELTLVDMDYLTNPADSYMLHHLFHKIEASKIEISCIDSPAGERIQLAEVQVHSWMNNDGGSNGGIMDAYYPEDLSEGADVSVSSQNGNNFGTNVIDNDVNTVWISDGDCPQDIMIDLGQEYFIGAMKIVWEIGSFDSHVLDGEIRLWSAQNGWQTIFGMNYQVNNPVDFFHFHPQQGQKILLKCFDFDLDLEISEIEIFEAKPSWYSFDFDNDGIENGDDGCYWGESDWISDFETDHDGDGCFDNTEDWDDDNDGIDDSQDSCPLGQFNWDSWDGDSDYDHDGCFDDTEDQDDDADGRTDVDDDCLLTRLGAVVDENGCETSFPDQDNDGVADSYDQCQQTPSGTEVDSFNGCPINPDSDGDGHDDNDDMFPNDPLEWNDGDGDGVGDNADECPNTDNGEFVGFDGCTIINNDPTNGTANDTTNDTTNDTVNETANNTGIDTDGDGVNDLDTNGTELDKCPDTEEGVEVDEFGCAVSGVLPPALASALDFILNIDELFGLPDGTLEILFTLVGVLFGVIRFAGKRTLAGKTRRVEKYANEIRMARSRRELENLEKRITRDNEKNLLPPGGFGDLMELIETKAIELGEMDMATHVREVAAEEESMRESHDRMLEEMEGTREAVAGLQDELSQMRRKGPPGKGRGRKGPPRRRGSDDSGYKIKESGGPRRPSLHPADLDGDGFVTAEERKIYRERQEQEDDLWEFD